MQLDALFRRRSDFGRAPDWWRAARWRGAACLVLLGLLSSCSSGQSIGGDEVAGAGRAEPVLASDSGAPSAADAAGQAYISAATLGQVVVAGTSTLHDWTVTSHHISGSADFVIPGGAATQPASPSAAVLRSADVAISVLSLKSGDSGLDSTMYDALKQKQFPLITYHLLSARLLSSPTPQDPAYHFDAVGRLIIAGTARDIDLKLSVQAEGQHLVIWARTSLKMTDFNVEPPTAMLGMIRSGDTVRVDVSWQLMARPPQARSSQARSPQARS